MPLQRGLLQPLRVLHALAAIGHPLLDGLQLVRRPVCIHGIDRIAAVQASPEGVRRGVAQGLEGVLQGLGYRGHRRGLQRVFPFLVSGFSVFRFSFERQ